MCQGEDSTTPDGGPPTAGDQKLPGYTWEEIQKHSTKADRWIAINGYVYDITNWAKKHPGGERLISHYAGQDATEAWVAFHNDRAYVSKFMKSILVGKVINEGKSETPVIRDFRELRQKAEGMGWFKTSPLFFSIMMMHIILLELGAWLIFWYFGVGWLPYLSATVLLVTSQAQAGWLQHDFGHLSVFSSSKWNHILHIFSINILKGASSNWWNYRHFQHHAKPNIIKKDPDVRMEYVLLLGKSLPLEWGRKRMGYMPYNLQHKYFHFVLPPLLLPVYFNLEIPYYLIVRRRWWELLWIAFFFTRYQFMFAPVLNVGGTFLLYFFVRFLESHWFVWTTQMNHIPMDIDWDSCDDWVTMQLKATCNVEQSLFNDWFTGHLNFQIEHHLFPTMPRHNYHKVAPLVKSLCKKHGLDYHCKPILTACGDIIRSLEVSGKLWYEAYHM